MKIDPANGASTDAERSDVTGADGGTEVEARPASADDADGTDDPAEPKARLVDDSTDSKTDIVDAAGPLTITLPDGSESVSEAILSNRRMLTNPEEHGLVSAGEVDDVRGALDTLSAEVSDDLRDEVATLETSLAEAEKQLDRQSGQIEELRDTVSSLAEILGASVEFQEPE
jgi:ABC-type transporter Mla subunit MlaD